MNNQLIELLNSFKFHCEAYINQFKQLCEICEIPDKSELIGKEQLYEYGTEIKKINGWYKAKTPLSNPYLHPEFTGNRAAFDQYYYNKVNEVSRLLIDTLNSYLIENSNHDAIKKLLRKDLDTYENFKDFECLNELQNFKTAIKLIIEQCDYKEKNNGATPEFNRILELRKETEFYYKTDCSNVHGNNLEVMYNIQHLQDYKNFQKKIDSCNDAETLKAHLTETFRKWKGKKSQWIEYTLLSIAPPNSNNNVLKTSAWFEWFESHKEQENEPISNDVAIEVKPVTNKQKALIAVYKNENVTRLTHGNDVYNLWLKLNNSNNRIADPESTLKYKNKVDLFKTVIEILTEPYKQKALDDLNTLKSKYENDYL
jgi:hypothetical protein